MSHSGNVSPLRGAGAEGTTGLSNRDGFLLLTSSKQITIQNKTFYFSSASKEVFWITYIT